MPSPNNKILTFARNALEGTNLQTQEQYEVSPETTDGVATGLANGSNFNKFAKQTSLMASSLAQFITERLQDITITDSLSVEDVSSHLTDSIINIVSENSAPGVNVIDDTQTAITSFNHLTDTGIYWCYKHLDDGPEKLNDLSDCCVLVANYTTSNVNFKIKVITSSLPYFHTQGLFTISGIAYIQVMNGEDIVSGWTETTSLDITNSMINSETQANDNFVTYNQEASTVGSTNWDNVADIMCHYKHLMRGYTGEDIPDLNTLQEGIFLYTAKEGTDAITNAPSVFTADKDFTVLTINKNKELRKQLIFKGFILGSETYIREENDPNVWSEWITYTFNIDSVTTSPATSDNILMIDSNSKLVKRSVESLQGAFGSGGGESGDTTEKWTTCDYTKLLPISNTGVQFAGMNAEWRIIQKEIDGNKYDKFECKTILNLSVLSSIENGGTFSFQIGVPYPEELSEYSLWVPIFYPGVLPDLSPDISSQMQFLATNGTVTSFNSQTEVINFNYKKDGQKYVNLGALVKRDFTQASLYFIIKISAFVNTMPPPDTPNELTTFEIASVEGNQITFNYTVE